MADSIEKLLEGNRQWVKETLKLKPDFFKKLAPSQKPEFLWIGCADSRVPATEITGTNPGSIFVHRNIANMVIHTDSNCLSVVYYAVKVLKVKHIIVCGHYGCGGIAAAVSNERIGFIDNWVLHIKDVYRLYAKKLDAIADLQERANRLVELNVKEQVHNLSKISFIQKEWDKGEFPYIHGWVYKLTDGYIKDLNITVNSANKMMDVFQYKPS